jgi:hypothetical protein
VVKYMDGQSWKPSAYGNDGLAEYMTASCTTSIRTFDAESDYRETSFRVYPEAETVQFFHGCSISKYQYEKAMNRMRLQFDE